MEGVDGRDGVGVLPDPGSGIGATRGKAWAEYIRGGNLSSSSTGGTVGAPSLANRSSVSVDFSHWQMLKSKAVEMRSSICRLRGNQPDFF